ncbi:MAG: ATP-grasp domain-containing protein [Phycisphaeraceae bacterium]
MNNSNYHFIFPAHPLRPKLVEPTFANQYKSFQDAGFTVSTIPDEVIDGQQKIRNMPSDSTVVYRGWMMNAKTYSRLEAAVTSASGKLLIDLETYLGTHHLPNWYGVLKDLTPETIILPSGSDFSSEIAKLSWDQYFVKDYVKSLTTSRGSIAKNYDDIEHAISEFIDYRGELEGGLCLRRVEPLQHETECRYFIIMGKAFGPTTEAVPDIVNAVAERIQSSFYSVDIIQREDGVLRLVEIGDGQVSDLKSWSAEAMARIWKQSLIGSKK